MTSSSGTPAPCGAVGVLTLLDPWPRSEDRGADANVCRAGPDRLLQIGAHAGRQPGRLRPRGGEVRMDPGELPVRLVGIDAERRHRHQPAQPEQARPVDLACEGRYVVRVGPRAALRPRFVEADLD